MRALAPPAHEQGYTEAYMSHINDMYQMVKAAKKEARRMDKLERQPIIENDHKVWWSAQDNVKRAFLKHRQWRGWTASEAEEVLMDCCSEKYGYLDAGSIKSDGTFMLLSGNDKVDVVKLTAKGRRLIEKGLLGIPTGLLHAWYKENGWAFLTIAGFIAATLVSILGVLIKIAASDQGITINLSQSTTTTQSQAQTQSKPVR